MSDEECNIPAMMDEYVKGGKKKGRKYGEL